MKELDEIISGHYKLLILAFAPFGPSTGFEESYQSPLCQGLR